MRSIPHSASSFILLHKHHIVMGTTLWKNPTGCDDKRAEKVSWCLDVCRVSLSEKLPFISLLQALGQHGIHCVLIRPTSLSQDPITLTFACSLEIIDFHYLQHSLIQCVCVCV